MSSSWLEYFTSLKLHNDKRSSKTTEINGLQPIPRDWEDNDVAAVLVE